MNREEIGELAAAYALGGLEGADRARFEALLRAGDPEAVAALREFEGTLADPAAAAPPVARPPERRLARARRAVWVVVLSGAMAAGLAAIVVGWSVSSTYEQRLDTLARDAERLRAELRSQQTVLTILRDPATQMVALAGQAPAPTARGHMMWHAKAGGVFVVTGLPEAPAGETYQLWAIVPTNAPVSAGVFNVDASGTGSLSVRPLPGVATISAFAVTLEPAGGRPAPSGEMYLLGKS